MASWWQGVVPGGWCHVRRSHKLRVPRHGPSLATQTPNWTLIEFHCIGHVLWDTGLLAAPSDGVSTQPVPSPVVLRP